MDVRVNESRLDQKAFSIYSYIYALMSMEAGRFAKHGLQSMHIAETAYGELLASLAGKRR